MKHVSTTLSLDRQRRVAAFAFVAVLISVISVMGFASPARAATPHVEYGPTTSTCAACHSSHAAPGRLLTSAAGASGVAVDSCLACHDGAYGSASNVVTGAADSFGLPSGHSLATETPGTVRMNGCATCHDPHGASSVKRRIPAETVNGVAVTSAGKALCLACHESSAAWFGPGYPATSAPKRDATGYPVAGTWPGSGTYGSATNAHRLIPEATRTVASSVPIVREQGDCLYCHAAHRGANTYDGLTTTYTVTSTDTLTSDRTNGDYAALCFTCHGGTTPSGSTTRPVDIRQFVTTATAGASSGHAIVTSGGLLPVGAPLPCFECHNPHGSSRGNGALLSDERGASLGTTGDAGVRTFCFTCHTTSDSTSGWDSTSATYTAVAVAAKVVGLPRSGARLHLSDIAGHRRDDITSCYDCHGSSYSAGGRNVHSPGDGHLPVSATLDSGVTSTVTTPSVDMSPTVEASGSIGATASIDSSATPSMDPTQSTAATSSVLATDAPFWPLLPPGAGAGTGDATGAGVILLP